MHLPENLSINTMNKNFASNLLSQGSNEQDYLSKNVKNLSFWDGQLKYKFQYWISVQNQLRNNNL